MAERAAMVSRFFAAFRDVCAWYTVRLGRNVKCPGSLLLGHDLSSRGLAGEAPILQGGLVKPCGRIGVLEIGKAGLP